MRQGLGIVVEVIGVLLLLGCLALLVWDAQTRNTAFHNQYHSEMVFSYGRAVRPA
jgi:hypothetical protein